MNVAEQVAGWLCSQGIDRVFSVTGGGAMFLNQAFGSRAGIDVTYMHHEQACAMAAEGYARISGKPAVVVLTTGPGAINALNGVFGAFTDSIPMIVLSGQVKRETCLDFQPCEGLRQLGDQEGPTYRLAAPISKFAALVRTPESLGELLPGALHEALSGRPGPVWLDIPLDIQSAKTPISFRAQGQQAALGGGNHADQLARIVDRLARAHRPLILGGTGVRLSGVQDRLVRLAERIGVPVATAWTHDLIASDHPLFAGRPGTIGTRAGNFCLQQADVVLVLGSRLNIRQTSYNYGTFAKNAWVVQVDIDAAELQKPTYQPDLGVVADLRVLLPEFEEALEGVKLPDFSPWASWCRQMRERFSFDREYPFSGGSVLNPYHVVRRIFQGLRPDDIVVCANASACILPFQVGKLQAGQRLFSNSGSASMGYELPAAIGAAVAAKAEGTARRVIVFAGDGSLQMNIQELQTLKTSGLAIVVVVLNNGGYLSIWQTHENFFGKVIGATPASGVEFPDFSALGSAYGIPSQTIRGPEGLLRLDEILLEDGPMLLDVEVDPEFPFTPRIKSRVDESGRFITPELDDMHPFLDPEELASIRAEAAEIRAIQAD